MEAKVSIKTDVTGKIVKLLHHKQTMRGMTLIPHKTRCLQRYQIHELVTTDHKNLAPGDAINRVGFLGFAELSSGGVVEAGDRVFIEKQLIGTVSGFDECHFPNHYNIIIETDRCLCADDLHLSLNAEISFLPGEQ
ncbi:hypothetical protein SG34_029840 [Thalassomonas viridans]|uniref:DUF6917 domain-containing protein n=1 Tax=Thalassomonas viridans TaxID=137584 RepID=A0AAF0CE35_9GAMM|nr:hypothetical protein [Thalassomonas viridans]WDE08985.1 hypothetical protein SG34_029840 [Thalassomonas viridans]